MCANQKEINHPPLFSFFLLFAHFLPFSLQDIFNVEEDTMRDVLFAHNVDLCASAISLFESVAPLRHSPAQDPGIDDKQQVETEEKENEKKEKEKENEHPREFNDSQLDMSFAYIEIPKDADLGSYFFGFSYYYYYC